MLHLSITSAAELLALRSLDSLVVGAAVWLFASVMLRIGPRQNAASRFAIWFAALLAIATIPVLGGIWSPSAGIVSGAAAHPKIIIRDSWALFFLALWAIISSWFLLQVARSLWGLHLLRRSCVAIDPATLAPTVQETLRKHGANRGVRLCSSSQVKVPTAVGLWRPAIVVPQWALSELSADELNQVVLDEVAHLRRWDDWTNLAEQVVKALLFFHPAVWWIERKASLEREMACDDAVLEETARPRAYAECLAHLAEKSLAHRSLALVQAAVGKVRQMSTRVAQILDANRPARSRAGWPAAACLVAMFGIGCGVWYSRAPRIVVFEDRGSSAPAAVVASVPAVMQLSATATPILASLKQTPSRQRALSRSKLTATRAKAPTPQSKSLVHYTGTKPSAMPVTQTVWIVVERNESTANRQVLQIEMWRLTILQGPANDSPRIPRKI